MISKPSKVSGSCWFLSARQDGLAVIISNPIKIWERWHHLLMKYWVYWVLRPINIQTILNINFVSLNNFKNFSHKWQNWCTLIFSIFKEKLLHCSSTAFINILILKIYIACSNWTINIYTRSRYQREQNRVDHI